jgi:hypothetical protein
MEFARSHASSEHERKTVGPADPGKRVHLLMSGAEFSVQWKEQQKKVYSTAIEHVWWEEKNFNMGEKIALVHSELSEKGTGLRIKFRIGHRRKKVRGCGDSPDGSQRENGLGRDWSHCGEGEV